MGYGVKPEDAFLIYITKASTVVFRFTLGGTGQKLRLIYLWSLCKLQDRQGIA